MENIIGFKPNSKISITSSSNITHGFPIVVISSDHRLFIFNRSNFKEKIIDTPNKSSKIILTTIFGSKANGTYLICINDNKELYQYSIKNDNYELLKTITLDVIPESAFASANSIFYFYQKKLFQIDNGFNKVKYSFDDLEFDNIKISPSGAAIALYTKNKNDLKLWFYPFTNHDYYMLPINSSVNDFQWAFSKYLTGVSYCSDGSITLWNKSKIDTMECSGIYHFDIPIKIISFINNCNISEYISTSDKEISNVADPYFEKSNSMIMAITENTIEILEENNKDILKIASIPLNCKNPYFSICDFSLLYTHKTLQKRFDVASISDEGLFFQQIEVSHKKFFFSTPFLIKFLKPIKRFVQEVDDLVCEFDDNSYYNFKNDSIIKYYIKDDNIIIAKYGLTILKNNEIVRNNKFYKINLNEQIKYASIYSSFIFSICTNSSVICYIFDNDQFVEFSRLETKNSIAQFLPNPYLLMCVCSECLISFYVVNRKSFKQLKAYNTLPIIDMKYSENSLIFATENTIFRFPFEKEILPFQYKSDCDFVVNTSLSLCCCEVFKKKLNNKIIEDEDFLIKDSNLIFPNEGSFKYTEWNTVDENGQKLIFSYYLIEKNNMIDINIISLICIWGLLCKKQHLLLSALKINSTKQIIELLIPLWVNTKTLTLFIDNFLTSFGLNDNDYDTLLLLCVLRGKYSLARKICKKVGNLKNDSVLSKNLSDELKITIEKNAYYALKVHKISLAALFFYLIGKQNQAISILKAEPLLMILVSRLLDCTNWKSLVREYYNKNFLNGFYDLWWNDGMTHAAKALIDYEPQEFNLFSLNLHKYEMIKCILGTAPNSLLIDFQMTPQFIFKELRSPIYYVKERNDNIQDENCNDNNLVKEEKDFQSFDFFSYDKVIVDDEYEWEEEEEIHNENSLLSSDIIKHDKNEEYENDFLPHFFQKMFNVSEYFVTSTSSNYIIRLLSHIFNNNFDDCTIRILISIVKILSETHKRSSTIFAIFFSLSFILSKANLIIPLLTTKLENIPIEAYFDEFENCEINHENTNILKRITSAGSKITENDVNILNSLLFHRISEILSKIIDPSNNDHLPEFFHHRHRIYYNFIKSFKFSRNGIIDELTPLGFDTLNILQTMEKLKIKENWLISINDNFSSPFYQDECFSYSFSYDIKTGSKTKSICINQMNNQQICVVSKHIKQIDITSERLTNDFEYDTQEYYDSPFSSIMKSGKNIMEKSLSFQREEFECNWNQNWLPKVLINSNCCASHPYRDFYVTGNEKGMLYAFNFNSKINYCFSYFNDPIKSLQYNRLGSKVLVSDKKGRIYLTDFQSHNLLNERQNSTVQWFNSETQYIVCDSINNKLDVIDILSGNSPVLSFNYDFNLNKKCPVSVFENYIASGHDNGRVFIFDIRKNLPISCKPFSSGRITALQYNKSGVTLYCGSSDNSFEVIETNNFKTKFKIKDIWEKSNYPPNKKGIKSIAVSNQAIVVGGYSPEIHIWTAVRSKGTIISKSTSSTIDLRNLFVD